MCEAGSETKGGWTFHPAKPSVMWLARTWMASSCLAACLVVPICEIADNPVHSQVACTKCLSLNSSLKPSFACDDILQNLTLAMPRVHSASSGELPRPADCSGCRKQSGTMQCIECLRDGSGSAVFCAHGCFKTHWQAHRQGLVRQSSR